MTRESMDDLRYQKAASSASPPSGQLGVEKAYMSGVAAAAFGRIDNRGCRPLHAS